jgi:DnaK suppressor protein
MDPAQLAQYKSTLLEMRRRLRREIGGIEEAVVEGAKSPGEISNAPTHQGSVADSNLDTNIVLAENEEAILQDVANALERIENGSFGLCENCGKEIAPERLEAIPYAPLCTACARQLESSQPAP